MKTPLYNMLYTLIATLLLTGCLNTNTQQNSVVMVSELTTICGALVGDQAEQRINQEWAKYPEAEASRSVIETMASVLLTNPESTEQQRNGDYKQYLTCATGLLMANGMLK